MIETVIYNLLKNESTITALVSTRIYPVMIPQGITGDCIVYSVIGGSENYSCDGPVGLIDVHIQITAIATRHANAATIARAVKSFLNGYSDLSSGIHYIKAGEPTDVPYIGESEDYNRYAKMIDCLIAYSE